MTMRLLFWILFLLWIIFGAVWIWPVASSGSYGLAANNLILLLLLLLLGWKVFGRPVDG